MTDAPDPTKRDEDLPANDDEQQPIEEQTTEDLSVQGGE